MFSGRYQHTLDPKGRLVLPVRFREAFLLGGHLTPEYVGCLSLWTPPSFEEKARWYTQRAQDDKAYAVASRHWSANSAMVEFDKTGRFAVPAWMRDLARLDGEVFIIGHIDHVELWNAESWEAYDQAAAASFKDLA